MVVCGLLDVLYTIAAECPMNPLPCRLLPEALHSFRQSSSAITRHHESPPFITVLHIGFRPESIETIDMPKFHRNAISHMSALIKAPGGE